jgi:hypothetical protein
VLTALLHRRGFRAWQMQILSLSAIGLCTGLWIRAKTVDQDERGNAGDLTDITATVTRRSELPSGSAVATAAVGGGSALLSRLLLAAVDR